VMAGRSDEEASRRKMGIRSAGRYENGLFQKPFSP
jgi:hypothetical protein